MHECIQIEVLSLLQLATLVKEGVVSVAAAAVGILRQQRRVDSNRHNIYRPQCCRDRLNPDPRYRRV